MKKMTNIIRLDAASKRHRKNASTDSDKQPPLEALIRSLDEEQRTKAFKLISLMTEFESLVGN